MFRRETIHSHFFAKKDNRIRNRREAVINILPAIFEKLGLKNVLSSPPQGCPHLHHKMRNPAAVIAFLI